MQQICPSIAANEHTSEIQRSITQPMAVQDSVGVGRRQEEVFVKILLDTYFADICFSQRLVQCPITRLPWPLCDGDGISPVEQLVALNHLQMSSPVTSSVAWWHTTMAQNMTSLQMLERVICGWQVHPWEKCVRAAGTARCNSPVYEECYL